MTCAPSGLASDFMVNTVNAGAGALSVTIDGPSKVKMDFQECPEGYKVSYTPMAPGSYLISIKYGGPQHIVGSPFKAKVTGESLGKFHLPCLSVLNLASGRYEPSVTRKVSLQDRISPADTAFTKPPPSWWKQLASHRQWALPSPTSPSSPPMAVKSS